MPEMLIVDAFAEEPFTGNPAGVCFLEAPAAEDWMQKVAAEMKHSETAFLVPQGDAWSLRWFTPAVEVNLCGHATLASAHALWSTGRLAAEAEARFDTRSGRLTCRRDGQRIVMDFPATPPTETTAPARLLSALGLAAEPRWVGRYREDFLVEVGSEAELLALNPDFRAVAARGGKGLRGVVVTARPTRERADFVSRFFAPGAGVDEDPVTGSAHCALAPYWVAQLGRNPLTGYQASQRGGWVGVEVQGERVLLSGEAVTVLAGRLV